MKLLATSLALFAAALCAPAASVAAPTNIAQVPLLNITGTGTVKPNLMLLLDNSGSMDQAYTPDYVNDNLCRTGPQLASGSPQACNVGFPPFMSSDFNKQYYNPAVRYVAPIKYDGTYYPDQTAAATTNYSVVSGDGFGAHKVDLYGNASTSINLLNGYPDVKWCDPNNLTSCQVNTATYTYPDNTYKTPVAINTGPYYYTIGVAEYCSDSTLKNCVSTAVGATAPTGYPVPAKVRWCNSTVLSNCQAKNTGAYVYPRYSTPVGSFSSYGTIAVGTSASTASMTVTSVVVGDANNTTIVNSAVTAPNGTKTALTQQTMASALAAAINNRSTTLQYMACVKTPIGNAAAVDCANFGIALTADNVVAVVPVLCSSTPKTPSTCVAVTDASRSGVGFTVNVSTVTPTPASTGVPPTALLTFSNNTTGNNAVATSVKLGGTSLLSNLALGSNVSATAVVQALQTKIGGGGTIRAYVGGNSITSICAAQTTLTLCLVDTGASANGAAPTAAISNAGFQTVTPANATSAPDSIPVQTAAIAAGSSPASTFVRVNLVAGSTYPKVNTRTDCVATAGVCTYNEEMVNFANWYVYYKTRIQMMKTSVGIAFSTLTANYNVGFARLSVMGAGGAIDIKPTPFAGTARNNWYTKLYATTDTGSTPMRPAMDNVGRMFANLAPYNYASGSEVVQFPCQQNFMILTTDGYWNGGSTVAYGNPAVATGNNDDKENPARFCTAGRGCVDTRAQSQPSIADVALHWYNGGDDSTTVSLRPALEPDMTVPGAVPHAPGENSHLHMNTYTLGLGVDGIMNYEPDYDTAPNPGGDFYNLINSVPTGCPWNAGGAYVWPDPDVTNTNSTVQSRVDDLWHAAVNGHGKYFSAALPTEVVAGISAALANIQVRTGSAAAAATSTPNITQQDNDIFSDTFTTVRWYGELADRKIDPATGIVGATVQWNSSDTVGLKVVNQAVNTDARTILMLSPNSGGLVNFKYASLGSGDKTWFDNKCASLPQCTLLSTADKAIVNSGDNLINWLRGQQTYADDQHFRAYTQSSASTPLPIVLGDIDSSKPAYLRDPRKNYTMAGYAKYKTDNSGRLGTVFTAANDGMLHAFAAASGTELWAYVPRITMSKLYVLSSTTYGTNHEFTTDGSPALGDVQLGGVWSTVLVAGLNAGGRGFYAVDVTAVGTTGGGPKPLWELCADPAVCANNDPDIGLTFGNPQYGMWNGKWVVLLTSGYNNIPGVDNVNTGSGQGFLYIVDVSNGHILKKVSTGAGDTSTPSGFAKITAIGPNPDTDPTLSYVYGGDNNGTMWRFDLTDTSAAATVKLLKMGDAGVGKPITTRPDVTLCAANTTFVDPVTKVSTSTTVAQRVVLFGSGRLLDVPDTSDTSVQSVFVLKDSGSTIANIHGATSVNGGTGSSVSASGTMVQQTLSLAGSSSNEFTYAITSNPVDLSKQDGWYADFSLNSGERVNLDPQIVSGVANIVTNIPTSSSACSVGGTANSYALNVCNGNAIASVPAGGTLSNTSAAVGFIIIRLANGDVKMVTTTADGNTLTTKVVTNTGPAPRRAGWRRVKGE
ncbi:PilC/PilY family type IV pilus protein [Rugamonas sp.]|uniref:pilus assembly protein n=1 Tax=Rugamonas sp. TaxID=1926287 RepID=UPI0025F9CF21|nr:PilC/PilY family type IV pilus protein [Rugamonas sp.]